MSKFIFVSGGAISGIGKGVSAASIGFILKSCEKKISMIKADPYLNIDAGTMNSLEHGETFVLDDGFETDMDIGTYGEVYESIVFQIQFYDPRSCFRGNKSCCLGEFCGSNNPLDSSR
jgi:CTP synthase (UTP-ammonia lyase)